MTKDHSKALHRWRVEPQATLALYAALLSNAPPLLGSSRLVLPTSARLLVTSGLCAQAEGSDEKLEMVHNSVPRFV